MASVQLSKTEETALKIVDLAKAYALAENHFLSAALGRLRVDTGEYDACFATDGLRLGIDAQKVCEAFKRQKTAPKRQLLHCVLHCVFLHPFAGAAVDRSLWNLACDIAVERNVSDICGENLSPYDSEKGAAFAAIDKELGHRPSAEKLYRVLKAGAFQTKRTAWTALFVSDDHSLWYAGASGESCDETDAIDEGDNAPGNEGAGQGDVQAEKEQWRRVAKALAVNLRTYAKSRGSALGDMVQELELSSHNRVSYERFLRDFAITGEVLKLSADEFDYIFYAYGLELYEDMPLIEPLEYCEQKRVREFVIVLDTSGSVFAEAVKHFVERTFDILKDSEAFFEEVQVHIVQCDASVQSDDVITCEADLDRWAKSVRLLGGGGTDFRPAFEYVDSLVDQAVFQNLGGLVYFTDGWGEYPTWTPDYKTAFVFYDDDYRAENVPTWATQIVLDEQGLGE